MPTVLLIRAPLSTSSNSWLYAQVLPFRTCKLQLREEVGALYEETKTCKHSQLTFTFRGRPRCSALKVSKVKAFYYAGYVTRYIQRDGKQILLFRSLLLEQNWTSLTSFLLLLLGHYLRSLYVRLQRQRVGAQLLRQRVVGVVVSTHLVLGRERRSLLVAHVEDEVAPAHASGA